MIPQIAIALSLLAGSSIGLGGCSPLAATEGENPVKTAPDEAQAEAGEVKKIVRSEAQWKALLSAEQYRVLRQGGTECSFTGKYWNEKRSGVYRCAGCGTELFRSDHKFRSGTGWPSFFRPIETKRVSEHVDRSHGMVRTEVRCAACEGHLGHVFSDGPEPTGKRYCINSVALTFDPDKEQK